MPDHWLDEVAIPALERAWVEILSLPPHWPEQDGSWIGPDWTHVWASHAEMVDPAPDGRIISAVEPMTYDEDAPQTDNVTQELMELVRAGDEPGFRALAGCVMPAEDVEPCWNGAQARIKEGHREAR